MARQIHTILRRIAGLFLPLLLLSFAAPASVAQECNPPSVLMSLPDTRESAFWGPYADFAEAVAEKLGITLTVEFAAMNDRFDYMEGLQKSLAGPDKPDYVAAFPYFGAVKLLLDTTAAAEIPVVTLNSDLGDQDRDAVGYPRERYKNWLLQSLADDDSAGYDLAVATDRGVRTRFGLMGDDVVALTAVGGNQMAASSLQRRNGLERFVRMSGGRTVLKQFVFTDWSYERGREVAVGLIHRYPDTQGVWAANLPLGLAVADAWKAMAGARVMPVIGAISGPFDERALAAVDDGTFSATVGGHFLEGGIVLVLMFDHFNGIDFVGEVGTGLRVPFQTVDAGNITSIRAILGDRHWRAGDYAKLSKCLNRKRPYYDFSLTSMLRP